MIRTVKAKHILKAALLGSALGGAATLPAQAAEVRGQYEVYIGGFHAGSMAFDAKAEDQKYAFRMETKSQGLVDWLIRFHSVVESEGSILGDRLQPLKMRSDYTWRSRERAIHIVFKKDGVPEVVTKPVRDQKGPEAILPEQMKGAVDPLTGLIAASYSADKNNCDRTIKVLDGHRLYALIYKTLGKRQLTTTYYAGEVLQCQLTFKQIAGKFSGDWGKETSEERSAVVSWARVKPHTPPIPVHISASSFLGNVVVHFTGLRPTAGRDSLALR